MCGSAQAAPAAYTWTGADGQVHFGDRPPQDSNARPVEIRVNTYTAPAEITQAAEAFSENRDVTVYTTRDCGYCKRAKAFLNRHRIPFREFDVENSTRGRADYRKLNGRGVPIILVGTQRMDGFSEDGLARMLEDAGYPP